MGLNGLRTNERMKFMAMVRGWEDSVRAELPCKGCHGVGLFRTSDVLAACIKCNTCRECGRDRMDPCGDCREWDKENRGGNGQVLLKGIRERRAHGE
jgi:DnaJ-class molecular chaperone